MADGSAVSASLIAGFDASAFSAQPFRHWLLSDILPVALCDGIDALPVRPPKIEDTEGKRETHNSSRLFFGVDNRRRHPVCAALAAGFQSAKTVERIERLCDVELSGKSHLRIEYCLDTDGFWLEPHTDIGAKLFTLLIYLSHGPGAEELGTDLYADPAQAPIGRAPAPFDSGLAFVPASDTWHGFVRRPIAGLRQSVIVNYVVPEWRSRHELAFPEEPVGQ